MQPRDVKFIEDANYQLFFDENRVISIPKMIELLTSAHHGTTNNTGIPKGRPVSTKVKQVS